MPSRRTRAPSYPLAIAAIACAMLAGLTRPASGHGTPFSVGYDALTGTLTVSPGIYRNFNPEEVFVLDGGLVTNDGTPGWDRGPTLPAGTALSIRFVDHLHYWNPQTDEEDPLPVPLGRISIFGAGGTAEVAAASLANPSGITGTNPMFLASFTSHHHVAWEILDPDSPGLYGLWATLESTNPASFPAAPSDPFLVVLNYGVTDPAAYDIGVDRLAATAVPEPSTLALAAVAVVAGAWRSWKHRGRTTSRTSPTASSPRITHHDMSSSHQR